MKTTSIVRLFAVSAIAFAATACAVDGQDEEALSPNETVGDVSQAQAKGGGGTKSGACHVVSGANKGKTGTYNGDGDCSGDWGISECTEQNGTSSGRCADGPAPKIVVSPRPPVYGSSGTIGVMQQP